LLFASLLLLHQGPRCLAWGVTGHSLSNSLAIDCLPVDLKPIYLANKAWVAHHSIDPDEWRRDNFAAESPRHFIDLDTDGPEAALAYPADYWTAVGLLGKTAVDRNGTVPWRISEYYGKLVRAFRAQDARAVVEISTWLGHYVSDAHVPFHATVSYDGQLTNQKGIHARFEAGLIDQLIKLSALKPEAAIVIKEPAAAAFQWARASLALCPDLLAADKLAILKDADFGINYYTEFGKVARPIAIRRLEQSAHATASLWMSAWVEAGKPAPVASVDVHAGEPLEKATRDPDLRIVRQENPQRK
jgi:hypothetical protein